MGHAAALRRGPVHVPRVLRLVGRAPLGLGKTLGLETLAEGIEEDIQYAQLQREECDSGQGFLLAHPLAPDALERYLAESGWAAPGWGEAARRRRRRTAPIRVGRIPVGPIRTAGYGCLNSATPRAEAAG